jgi:hypothetical protein
LEFIFRRKNVQFLADAALTRDETLEVIAFSWNQKPYVKIEKSDKVI